MFVNEAILPALGDDVAERASAVDEQTVLLRGEAREYLIRIGDAEDSAANLFLPKDFEPKVAQDQVRRMVIGDVALHPILREGPIRPHALQQEALEALEKLRNSGESRALVVMATGLGKTILAALDAKKVGGRVLFIVHNNTILDQAQVVFSRLFPDRTFGFMRGGEKTPKAEIVFANVATLRLESNLKLLNPKDFDYVIYDEFHHVGTMESNRVALYFRPKFFLGLTGTPNRTDRRCILEAVDGNVAYQATQRIGIQRGFLSPFHYYGLHDDIDYAKIPHNGFSYHLQSLNRALIVSEREEAIIREFRSRVPVGQAIGFCTSIEHAEASASSFKKMGIPALAIHSRCSNRAERVQRFRNQEVRVAFVCDIFNEGVDFPEVVALMFLRPTQSKTIFTQQLGRGLRLSPGKTHVTVLDFIGNYKNAQNVRDLFNFRPSAEAEDANEYLDEPKEELVSDEYSTGGYQITKYSLGVEVHFDARVIEHFALMDEGIETESQVLEAYFEISKLLPGPVTMIDLHRASLSVDRIVRAYGNWQRFLERLSSLDEPTEALRWPDSIAALPWKALREYYEEMRGSELYFISQRALRGLDRSTECYRLVCQLKRTKHYVRNLENLLIELENSLVSTVEELDSALFVLGFDSAGTEVSNFEFESPAELDWERFLERMEEFSRHRDIFVFARCLGASLTQAWPILSMLERKVRDQEPFGSEELRSLSSVAHTLQTRADEFNALLDSCDELF